MMQVSLLAGYAVEQAAYSCGQQSAEETIINMWLKILWALTT
jgi:hypothetical protein